MTAAGSRASREGGGQLSTVVRAVAVLAILVVVLLAIFGAVRLARFNPFGPEPYTDIGPTVVQSVRDLSQLTTVEQVQHTTIDKGRGGFLSRFIGDRVFLFAVARIGAGVDLGRLEEDDFEVDREQRRVRITIPAAEIQYVAIDNDATQVYDRDTGIFTKGDRNLETQARQVAEAELREQALASGILGRAHENAVRTLTAFLRSLGYDQIEIVAGEPLH